MWDTDFAQWPKYISENAIDDGSNTARMKMTKKMELKCTLTTRRTYHKKTEIKIQLGSLSIYFMNGKIVLIEFETRNLRHELSVVDTLEAYVWSPEQKRNITAKINYGISINQFKFPGFKYELQTHTSWHGETSIPDTTPESWRNWRPQTALVRECISNDNHNKRTPLPQSAWLKHLHRQNTAARIELYEKALNITRW